MIQRSITALLFILALSVDAIELTTEEEEFLSKVVDAVGQKDVDWIVENSLQPMAIKGDGNEKLLSESEYRKLIDYILSSNFGESFKSKAKNERFKNEKGVMIGRGELWFEKVEVDEESLSEFRILIFGAYANQPKIKPNRVAGGINSPSSHNTTHTDP